ncbi:hypothetical protein RclHR1_17870001 [Rhizophagus clarus]|uniref:HMG box domain-containing protein n=1 Tax=Rhizophagus clarus TaxID=94130 RepID=A0A2Z6QZM9_9GLOM|nr:hypothetical protein RclHR1_17870001 [Rhizophagus clarus]GES78783.1 hypothetical protein GLOIN_2v1669744 [Rhizophagus clarus]
MNETVDSSIIFSNSNANELNKCVFINTNNPEVKNHVQKKKLPCPLIKPPFPPLIDPKDLLIIGKDNKPTRSPNAFIIYRKVFFKTIKNEGHVLPMTSISSMASQSWEQESEEIKNYYKMLAKEAFNYRNELFPKKVSRRKRREKWNIISFKSNTPTFINNNNDNNYVPENINDEMLNTENLQLLTQSEDNLKNPLFDAFLQLNQINDVLLQNLIVSNELSLNILNNIDNDQVNMQPDSSLNDLEQFNNYFTNNFDDNNELQQEQIYPSPNSSLNEENNLASPNLDELFNTFPIENLRQMENINNEQIEQEKEIQQFVIDDLSQQFPFLQNNESIDLNSFNTHFDATQTDFFDCLDNLNNDSVTINDTITEINPEPLLDFMQYEGPDDLGISFSNADFEKFFSL